VLWTQKLQGGRGTGNTLSQNVSTISCKELLNADAPAECAPEIIEALSQSCAKHQWGFIPMISRAYRDSLFMSHIAPFTMLFIPCRNGYSHRPDEYASPEDIERGITVLAETLAALAA
jgi:ureidoglycolate amidohydrolase